MTDFDPLVDAWTENTSPFDRVWSVVKTVSEPRPARWIAAEAAVSESTDRGHLERVVEINVLLEYDDAGTATYASDPIHMRFQTVRELLDEHDLDDLISLKEDLRAQTETWRDEYEVESPEELREVATGSDITEQAPAIRRTATEWEVTEYRLDVVEDVIDKYDTYRCHRLTE